VNTSCVPVSVPERRLGGLCAVGVPAGEPEQETDEQKLAWCETVSLKLHESLPFGRLGFEVSDFNRCPSHYRTHECTRPGPAVEMREALD
jgi:hypothetical protein